MPRDVAPAELPLDEWIAENEERLARKRAEVLDAVASRLKCEMVPINDDIAVLPAWRRKQWQREPGFYLRRNGPRDQLRFEANRIRRRLHETSARRPARRVRGTTRQHRARRRVARTSGSRGDPSEPDLDPDPASPRPPRRGAWPALETP